MTESCVLLLLVGILSLTDGIFGDSDLQSALDALDRRQREIVEYEKQQQYGFTPYENVDELAFLKNAAGTWNYILESHFARIGLET